MFGFDISIELVKNYDFYDTKAGKWIGITGGVCDILTTFLVELKQVDVITDNR